MRYCIVILFAIIWAAALALADSSTSAPTGQLCLAVAPTPNDNPKSLANPNGGNPDVEYSVRINGNDQLTLSRIDAKLVPNLDPSIKHLVEIFENGKRIESFRYSFPKSQESLCLFQKPLYLTWILWPTESAGVQCACSSQQGGD